MWLKTISLCSRFKLSNMTHCTVKGKFWSKRPLSWIRTRCAGCNKVGYIKRAACWEGRGQEDYAGFSRCACERSYWEAGFLTTSVIIPKTISNYCWNTILPNHVVRTVSRKSHANTVKRRVVRAQAQWPSLTWKAMTSRKTRQNCNL